MRAAPRRRGPGMFPDRSRSPSRPLLSRRTPRTPTGPASPSGPGTARSHVVPTMLATGCGDPVKSWNRRGILAAPGEPPDDASVNSVVVFAAQYLIYGLVVVAGWVWWTRSRAGKAVLGAQAVAGLVLVGVGILLAGALHSDPRPFVSDPGVVPLFAHAVDNGFPSDHSAAVGLLAVLVLRHRRRLGIATAVGAVLVAAARVAAHVHHVQDVVAGLAIGAAAGALAIWLVDRVVQAARRRGLTAAPRALTTADRASSAAADGAEDHRAAA